MNALNRRHLLAAAAWLPGVAWAHHGWSSFDQDRPLFLEGTARRVKWQNPHVELVLELPPALALPADLRSRILPAQTSPVDGAGLLARTSLPTRRDRTWEVELAPLFRMNLWQVPEIRPGQALQVLGFTFAGERGEAILRAEYLWLDGKAYGLRSSPA
jgi:hypothetical protein